jgi:DNA polymerase-3 subunit epsilon
MNARAASVLAALRVSLAVLAGLLAIAAVLWADLRATEREALAAPWSAARLGLAVLLLAPAFAALIWILYRRAEAPRQAAARLAEGLGVVTRVNPAHRIRLPPGSVFEVAANAANELAEERARLLVDVAAKVAEANAGVEEERNRLAALLAELEQSVLVCNREGRILLYNAAVGDLLAPERAGEAAPAVGLGRSAFGIIDRELIEHALETLEAQAGRGERQGVQFVTATAAGRMLRVQAAPVLGPGAAPAADAAPAPPRPMTGFVLLLSDVTENIDSDARSVALFQDLVESTRGAIASIRAAIETMIAHPQLDEARRARFAAIVQNEAVRLSERLDTLGADVSARLHHRWPLEEMRGVDLLALAKRRIERRGKLAALHDEVDPKLWLRVDSFSLVQAICSLASRLQEEFAVREVRFRLQAVERQGRRHAQLDLAWKGVPMSSETAFNWQNDAFTLGGEDSPLSLAQVIERHGGEAWYQRDAPSQTNYFRLLLPPAAERAAARAQPRRAERPEFYDFNLFRHSEASDALDDRRLAELSYTVFDTETTGLDPNQGDEIISIGAARIVNGRLLRSETFEALVDPQRRISPASVEVHGITPERVAGQPRIEAVLPRFWRFAEDTVLVGHNAAFDMRFLQLKEAQTGIRFHQPVLDTLLLAAVVHPSEPSQSLESIAARMGVAVLGRHTALGDALATAEVFLGLIPLLAARGIHTLGQARAASEQTFYARLKY